MTTITADPARHSELAGKFWTREEYRKFPEEAVEYEKFELVEGELISKVGKLRPHVNALILLQGWLVEVFGLRYVHPEAPIDVAPEDNPSNEPEPDLIVTRNDISHFEALNPTPSDLLLVVEIANTSLSLDLTRKARLYARAAIQEYWVIDVQGRRIIAHREPAAGEYVSVTAYREADQISPLASPDSILPVASLFRLVVER